MIGRMERKKFWILFPIAFILTNIAAIWGQTLAYDLNSSMIIFTFSIALIYIFSFWQYYLLISRLHDIGKSGKWVIVLFLLNITFSKNPVTIILPILYTIFLLYWCSKPSDGTNKYNDD